MIRWVLTRRMACVSFQCSKRANCFTVATNAHVQLCTFITTVVFFTTVNSTHLTVGGSKVENNTVDERAQRDANRKKHLQIKKTTSKCSQHNQIKKHTANQILYLVVLWAFAAPAVTLLKMFSWFAGAFSICMCFLKMQRVELSRPPYKYKQT